MNFKDYSQSPMRVKQMQAPDFYDSRGQKRQMDPMSLIVESSGEVGGMWLGSLEAASDLVQLKKHKIGAVLSLCPQEVSPSVRQYLSLHQTFYAQDVEHFDISQHFDQTYDFIDKARKSTNILIHCYAGISRSTTVIVAYLMRNRGYKVNETLDLVRSKRWHIYPNQGFLQQLNDFEAKLISNNYTNGGAQDLSGHDKGPKQVKAVKFVMDQISQPTKLVTSLSLVEPRHTETRYEQPRQVDSQYGQTINLESRKTEFKYGQPLYGESRKIEHSQADPRQVEPRQVNPRQVDPRQVNPRQLDPRQVDPRQVNPRQVNPRQQDPRQVEPRLVEFRQGEPRQVNTRQIESRKVESRQEDSRYEDPRQVQADPRRIEARQLESKQVEPRYVEPRLAEPRQVEPRKLVAAQLDPRQVDSQYGQPRQVDSRKFEINYQRIQEHVNSKPPNHRQQFELDFEKRGQPISNREYKFDRFQDMERKMNLSQDVMDPGFNSNRAPIIPNVQGQRPTRYINEIMSMSMDPDTYKTYLKPSQYEEIRRKYLNDDNKRSVVQDNVRETLVKALKDNQRLSFMDTSQNDRTYLRQGPYMSQIDDYRKTRPSTSQFNDYQNRDVFQTSFQSSEGFRNDNLRIPQTSTTYSYNNSISYNHSISQSTNKQQFPRESNMFASSYFPQRNYLHY